MGHAVTSGTQAKCSFGDVAPIIATSQTKVLGCGKPVATIADLPQAPFGMCKTPTNPAVAAATAAALGVLTPAPCACVPAGPWTPGKASVLIGGKPVITTESSARCAYGGQISIVAPQQTKVVIS